MTVEERLIEGRELIRRGWWQNGQGQSARPKISDTPRHCASTALFGDYNARLVLAQAIGLKVKNRPFISIAQDIYQWNDDPERRLDDVLAAYDRAIEAERLVPT